MNKADIIKALPSLPDDDLREIGNAVKANLQYKPAAPSGTSKTPQRRDYLFEAITNQLIRTGKIVSAAGIFKLSKRSAYEVYKAKRPALDVYLKVLIESPGAALGERHLPQICFIAANALSDLLYQWNIWSVSAMLSQIDKIPEAIEMAFPRYVESHIFGFVVLQVEKNNVNTTL